MKEIAVRGEESEEKKKRNAFSRIRRARGQVGANHDNLCEISGCCDWQGTSPLAGCVGKEGNAQFFFAATVYLELCQEHCIYCSVNPCNISNVSL